MKDKNKLLFGITIAVTLISYFLVFLSTKPLVAGIFTAVGIGVSIWEAVLLSRIVKK